MVSLRSDLAVTRAPGERSKKLAIAEGTGSQIRMTNDEIRRDDEIRVTKPASAQQRAFRHSSFGFLSLFVIRHSSFNFLWALLSVFGWQPPACGANSVLGAWLNSQTNIQTWSAEVIQTRALKSLAQPLTATGRVWFAAPNRFRWELGNPAQTIALRQPDQMLVIYPKLKRAERYPLTREHAGPWTDTLALIEAGFPRSLSELESRFRIESEATADGVHEVTLQPKSASARRMMPHIKIAFATSDFSLRATELQFADGSRMRNDFTNAVMNPKLDDSVFASDLDPTFKVIEPLTQK
jgi:outer membrane lipoprotein-sorting protein